MSGEGDLSPRLAELAKPAVRAAPPAGQAAALSLAPRGPGSLIRKGNRVVVDVRFDSGAGTRLDALRAADAQVVHLSRKYQIVTVAIPPSALHRLAGVGGVQAVTEDLSPIVYGAGDSMPVTSTASPCFGAATSEGDLQLHAMAARDVFPVDGSEVTVGILSDSFDRDASAPTHAAQGIASGDLPGPGNPCGFTTQVNVLSDPGILDSTDEGRAMAEIVHDLAPGAALAFAAAPFTDQGFADNVKTLANTAGAKVIVDDISYFDEPFFQKGPVGIAVSDVTANKGVTYLAAAGNNNLIGAGPSWEAPSFRDASSCLSALVAIGASHCMDFDSGAGTDTTFGITVSSGATLTLDLQWAEPWNGVTADLDAFLLDSKGGLLTDGDGNFFASVDDNTTTQRPFEFIQWTNSTGSNQLVQLAINRCFGVSCNPAASSSALPRLKVGLLQNGGGISATEYSTSANGDVVGPTIFGHNGDPDAISVGAIRFNTGAAPESFSSRGPVTYYFGPADGVTAAAPLTPAQTFHKPDIVATDGGATTFFGACVGDAWRFFGTSAAAPHAAAVAALELDADSAATVSEIKQAQTGTAHLVGSFPVDAVGAGLIDAPGAVGQILSTSPGSGSEFGPGFPPPSCTSPPSNPPPTPPASPVPTDSVTSTTAPQTSFAKRPHKVVRVQAASAFVSFRFRASEQGVTFLCAIDGGRFHRCGKKLSRRFGLGAHTVRVAARDADGNLDPTPAVYRFRVKQIA
jgi:Subtilase family